MRLGLFRRTLPDPSSLSVEHAGERFSVTVRRHPDARRLTLRIAHATGEVVLTLPQRSSIETARRFAEGHGAWIAGRVRRLPERVAFVPGAVVPLRGVPHRIVRWSAVPGATAAARDADGAPVIAVSCEPAHVPRRVKDFLCAEAGRDLRRAVAAYTAALGVAARKITVRDTRTRWGSCAPSGRLSFSWRLVMAPPSVLDYLAAHEVAHLQEMNHSARFWRLLRKLCPQTEEAERWLKQNGAGLHRFG